MDRKDVPRSAWTLLACGLLLCTTVPLIARHYGLPDSLRGFLTGIGLSIECLALVRINRYRRAVGKSCWWRGRP